MERAKNITEPIELELTDTETEIRAVLAILIILIHLNKKVSGVIAD